MSGSVLSLFDSINTSQLENISQGGLLFYGESIKWIIHFYDLLNGLRHWASF